MHNPDPKAITGEPATSADDRKAWRDHVRMRHAVADLLRQVQRFWRRAGLDDLQPASNLLTRLVDTCPVPPDPKHADPNVGNRLLVGILDEGIRELDEAQWLIDLHQAVSGRPREARDGALRAVRDGRADRETQRAGVVAGLRSKADKLWTRDISSALDHRAIEIATDIRRQLSKGLVGIQGRAPTRDDMRRWCADRVSRGFAESFEKAVASAQALAVSFVEEGHRECGRQVANSDEVLRQLLVDGTPLSTAPDPWQALGDVQIPDLDEDPTVPFAPAPHWRSTVVLSFVERMPGVVGRLAFIARLRREVAIRAASVARELAERLRQQLHVCIQRIDLVSVAALDRSLRRVEVLLRAGAADDPLSASAVRTEWASLVGRLRQAQSSLSLGMPIPENVIRQAAARDDPETTRDAEPNASNNAPVAEPLACPVCAAAGDAVFTFLCHHHRVVSAEGEERRGFLEAGGLCPSHTWYLEPLSAPRGLSATYPPLLDSLAERLRAFSTGPLPLPATDSTACAACQARRAAEDHAIGTLVESLALANPDTAPALQTCQFHLPSILGRLPPERAAKVLAAASDRLARLADDMREYALKLDALRGSRLTAEESQAYLRALAFLAGERKVF